jgi:hypothetical protein
MADMEGDESFDAESLGNCSAAREVQVVMVHFMDAGCRCIDHCASCANECALEMDHLARFAL